MKEVKNIATAWAVMQIVNGTAVTVAVVFSAIYIVLGGGDLVISWGPNE